MRSIFNLVNLKVLKDVDDLVRLESNICFVFIYQFCLIEPQIIIMWYSPKNREYFGSNEKIEIVYCSLKKSIHFFCLLLMFHVNLG